MVRAIYNSSWTRLFTLGTLLDDRRLRRLVLIGAGRGPTNVVPIEPIHGFGGPTPDWPAGRGIS